MFATTRGDDLRKALRSASLKDIKTIFGKSTEPLSEKEVIQVLRLLLGRSNFDFEMVDLLRKRHCDLNMPLGDKKTDPDQYRIGDYLSSYGRLSPRLIHEMDKAGYKFSQTNTNKENAGFYLISSAPINYKLVAALKSKGLDFSQKNVKGKTLVDELLSVSMHYPNKHYKDLIVHRLSPLFDNKEDINSLVKTTSLTEIGELVSRRIAEIQPKSYENVGIQDIYKENAEILSYAYSIYTNKNIIVKGRGISMNKNDHSLSHERDN